MTGIKIVGARPNELKRVGTEGGVAARLIAGMRPSAWLAGRAEIGGLLCDGDQITSLNAE